MTAQNIIDRTRTFLKDDVEPYRLSNADFFPWISDALQEMEARRPDLLLQSDGTFLAVADIAAVGDTINFPDRTREAIACYTAYRSYITEDADRHNMNQASFHLGQFERKLATI